MKNGQLGCANGNSDKKDAKEDKSSPEIATNYTSDRTQEDGALKMRNVV